MENYGIASAPGKNYTLKKMEKNNFMFATRNIPEVQIADASSLNPYLLLQAGKIIFVDNALAVLEKHFYKK